MIKTVPVIKESDPYTGIAQKLVKITEYDAVKNNKTLKIWVYFFMTIPLFLISTAYRIRKLEKIKIKDPEIRDPIFHIKSMRKVGLTNQ